MEIISRAQGTYPRRKTMAQMEKGFKALFLNSKVNAIEASKITEIKNFGGFGNKPKGCLWFARYTPESRFLSDWQKWCYYEQFNIAGVFGEGIIFTFKEDARVCVVNSPSDYKALCAAYPIDENVRYTVNKIDWVKLALDFDVFFLTEDGRQELYSEFYGWDVESGVVFNASAIESQSHLVVDTEAIVGVEAAEIMANPNAKRLYIYSVKVPCKGRVSGFLEAENSYEVLENLWQKFTSPTNSYSRNQEICNRIKDSLEVYLAKDNGMALCEPTDEFYYF